ncbi:MAG: XRE family transcriptional regulator [Acetilactobacillus jinshanensis]
MRLEIADLIKKQQLKKLKSDSAKNHHAKKVNDQKKGGTLADRRKQLHLSIPQISMMTGIDQITLKRWETNGMTPDDSISAIHKYAKVMHLDLQKLVSKILG